MTILNSTVSGNSSPFGGGVLNEADGGNATLAIVNSLVSDNVSTGGSPLKFGGRRRHWLVCDADGH